MRLGVTWNISSSAPISITIGDRTTTSRTKIFKDLRSFYRKAHSHSLASKPNQGKSFGCYSRDKASSHFFRTDDYLRFTDWRFIHQARLSVAGLYGHMYWHPPDKRSCREGGWLSETLAHMLNHCIYLPYGTRRHNKVVARVKNAALCKRRVLSQNQMISNTGLKPDFVLCKGNDLLIVHVTCPFDDGYESFINARKEKENKYKPLINHFKSYYTNVQVEAIVVGSLGSWDPRNDRVMLKLCSKKYLRLMKRLTVSEVIRSSGDIYIKHLGHSPQIDTRSLANRSPRHRP